MPKLDDFWLDGENAFQHRIHLQREIQFDAPEPVVDTFKVPGRNGDIIIPDGSFSNIDAVASCYCLSEDVTSVVADINSWLLNKPGYRRFETLLEPRFYRKARLKNGANLEPRMGRINPFELTFDCQPQKYYKDGDKPVEVVAEVTLVNPSQFDALPLITTHGSGSGSVVIDSYTLTLTDTDEVTLDCEEQEAYKNGTNMNSAVSGTYPKLGARSVISFSGGITSITLIPRWWTL